MKNIIKPGTNGSLIILSGPRGTGKTLLLSSVINEVRSVVGDMAGILSLPVEVNGEKNAIDALDIHTGEIRHLAIHNPGVGGALATQQWLFDPDTMQWADGVLARSLPCDLLIVDELGILEFERGQGWQSGLKALDGPGYRLAIAVIRPELLGQARKRWKAAITVKLTPADRLTIHAQLINIIRDRLNRDSCNASRGKANTV
jgi:nucleoside-triphosphatase THEP1